VNGASFQPGIAPSTWATIQGENLASTTATWDSSIVNGNLPTALAGVSVTFGSRPAYVQYVSPTQINLVVPDVPAGGAQVTVKNGTLSGFTTTNAKIYSPAFFPWPNNQPVATHTDFTYAAKNGTFTGATTVAAKPGEVIILWGTGFGPTTPVPPVGKETPATEIYYGALPVIQLNNTPVTVLSSVLAPGWAALFQIAIRIPANIADGDWPIQATVGGETSPTGVVLAVRR
jgi:uncharacterized protein (TIGR03437 family)